MPILLAVIGLFLPRVIIAALWLLSSWFEGVFETRLWPILGFLFMPYTLLWYSTVTNWYAGSWNWWQIIVLLIAIVADLHSDKESSKRR